MSYITEIIIRGDVVCRFGRCCTSHKITNLFAAMVVVIPAMNVYVASLYVFPSKASANTSVFPAVVNAGVTNVFTLHHPNTSVESGTFNRKEVLTLFVNLVAFLVFADRGIVIVPVLDSQ